MSNIVKKANSIMLSAANIVPSKNLSFKLIYLTAIDNSFIDSIYLKKINNPYEQGIQLA